jgi:hypothetical protein
VTGSVRHRAVASTAAAAGRASIVTVGCKPPSTRWVPPITPASGRRSRAR